MKRRGQLVTQVIYPITIAASLSALSLKKAWKTITPTSTTSRQRFECQYCCEKKRPHDFLTRGAVPYGCQNHITGASQRVCKTCVELAIAAQLDCKPLLEIGCPQCGEPWDPEDLKLLVGIRNQRRLRKLDQLARERVLIPEDVPDGETMEDLLVRGARFCPWCRWPFIKVGGCESMLCGKCGRCFNISYALILEDENGRRAAEIDDGDWD